MTRESLAKIALQLTELLQLPEGRVVGVSVDDNEEVDGWCVAEIAEDGQYTPGTHYKTIKELYEHERIY